MTVQGFAKEFLPIGSTAEIETYGNGLINDTYLVRSASKPFILQRINGSVFPLPGKLMENLVILFEHVRRQPVSTVKLQFPEIIKTRSGELCHHDEKSGYWRALSFIENTTSLEKVESHTDAQQAGFTLGHFHRLTSSLTPELLHDSLPGFHITPDYLNYYLRVKKKATGPKKSAESAFCEDFIMARQHQADALEKAKLSGLLKMRVIHGDPKLNNILFDRSNRQAVSIIDLDTVKPGLVHYDIGDCLRSCCNTEKEDSHTAHFELEICAAILESYLSETRHFFNDNDYDFLFASIRLVPFELGLRFYTDYLEGDRYFKTSEPDQNLFRAKAQFHLLESIEKQALPIKQLINHLRPG